jgi:hypothetical protein
VLETSLHKQVNQRYPKETLINSDLTTESTEKTRKTLFIPREFRLSATGRRFLWYIFFNQCCPKGVAAKLPFCNSFLMNDKELRV